MKKTLLFFILILCVCLISCSSNTADKSNSNTDTYNNSSDYKLVFSDDFNGDKLDKSIWGNEIGFIRNNEPQYYTDRTDNVTLKNGNLVITAQAEDFTASDGTTSKYTSASINTFKSKSFTYGKFEIKAKLPVTTCKATWPAFWMMGTTVSTLGWPSCGEVDILEAYGTDLSKYYSNVHWADESDSNDQYRNIMKLDNTISKKVNGSLGDDWHTYGIEWNEEKMSFYFDDETIGYADITDSTLSELHKPMYLILNLALTQEGDTTELDNGEKIHYLIDYIKVYQKQ